MKRFAEVMQRAFPARRDRYAALAFVGVALASLLFQMVYMALQWHQARENPTTSTRVEFIDSVSPAYRLCVDSSRGAALTGNGPGRVYMTVYTSHQFQRRGGKDVVEVSVDPALNISVATFDARLQKLLNVSIFAGSGGTYTDTSRRRGVLRKDPDYLVSCVLSNVDARTPLTPGMDSLVFMIVAGPRKEPTLAGQSQLVRLNSMVSLSLFDPSAHLDPRFWDLKNGEMVDLSRLDPVPPDPLIQQTLSLSMQYDISFTTTVRQTLDNERSTEFQYTAVSMGETEALEGRVLEAMGLENKTHGVLVMACRIRPSSYQRTIIEERVTIDFSVFIASVGGVIGVLASLFSVCFPEADTQPRSSRFGWADRAGDCAGALLGALYCCCSSCCCWANSSSAKAQHSSSKPVLLDQPERQEWNELLLQHGPDSGEAEQQ